MFTQTPWVGGKFDFNYPIGLFPIIVERLRASLPALKAVIADADEHVDHELTKIRNLLG
jgi:hypothetical protein